VAAAFYAIKLSWSVNTIKGTFCISVSVRYYLDVSHGSTGLATHQSEFREQDEQKWEMARRESYTVTGITTTWDAGSQHTAVCCYGPR